MMPVSYTHLDVYKRQDYAGIECPAVLLLNLMDVAEAQGKKVDANKLEEKLGLSLIHI